MDSQSQQTANSTQRKNFLFYSVVTNTVIDENFTFQGKDYVILNKTETINDLDAALTREKIIQQIGMLTLFKLGKSVVIYIETDSLWDMSRLSLLSSINSYLTNIIFSLWFNRDCSSNVEFTLNLDYAQEDCLIFRGATIFTNVSGLMSTEIFSSEEWALAESYSRKLLMMGTKDKDKKKLHSNYISNSFSPSGFNFTDYNKTNRIERAVEFLRTARASPIIAAKISFYVLILETLFSGGDSGELTYKLSQRIAGFLEPDYTKRKEIFKKVGKYYVFRSRHLHGQSLPGEYRFRDDLIKLSIEIDDMVRQIFIKILDNPEPFLQENGEQFRAYLDGLIYS